LVSFLSTTSSHLSSTAHPLNEHQTPHKHYHDIYNTTPQIYEQRKIAKRLRADKMGILHGAEMTLSYILHSVFRLIQIIMALAVCGLYGVDLNKADKEHKYSDGKWVRLSSSCPLPSPSI
jgi:hypothetical protein